MKMLSFIFLSVLLNVATASIPPQAFWTAYRTEMKKGFENFAFLPHVDEITLEAKDFVEGGYAKKVAAFYSGSGGTDVNPITDQGPGVFIFAGVGSTTTQAIAVEYDLTEIHAERSHGASHSVTSVEGTTLGRSFGAKDPSITQRKAKQLLVDLLHTQKTWADKKSVERNTVPVIFGKSLSEGLKKRDEPKGQLIKLIDIDADTDLEPNQAGGALKLLVIAAKKDHELKEILRGTHPNEKEKEKGPDHKEKPLISLISQFYLQPYVEFEHDAGAFPNFGVWFVRNLHENKVKAEANSGKQKELPGVDGTGAHKWAPIQAVGDIGGGATRTIVKWHDREKKAKFGKQRGQTVNALYAMAKEAGAGQPPKYAEPGNRRSKEAILSIPLDKVYIRALSAASKITDMEERWEAIGVALAQIIHSEMESAATEVSGDEQWPSKLPIVVLQTGAMRRDYFNPEEDILSLSWRRPTSIIGQSAAHSAYYDEYYYYGDQDYDYDEYDEGYDDDEYSLYEEAAANVRRAREEFRIAEQLRNWKGRGNSRLLSRYYH